MSRARREEKKNRYLGLIVLIVCFAVIVITFFMLHDLQNKTEKIKKKNTINKDEILKKIAEENTIQKIEDKEENIDNLQPNIQTNPQSNVTKNNETSSQITNQGPYTPAVTDDKEAAVDLVKKEWGEDSSVSFSFEYINENGEYVISVRDKASATVKNYFRVDINAGTVELD